MSKKSILLLVVLVVLAAIANHTRIIEDVWESVTGEYVRGVAPFVESYLLIVMIGALLRKRKIR